MCRNPGQQFSRLPLQATWMHHLRALCIHIYIHRFIHMHFHIYIKHYKALQYKHIRSHIYIRVGNCLVFFFSLGIFFWISGSHHFPCYLQHFGAGNCHFHGMCNGFEFEPLIFHCIFHGICNSLQHVLSIFHALCSIFELESAFPPYVQHFTATFLTVLAGFWS